MTPEKYLDSLSIADAQVKLIARIWVRYVERDGCAMRVAVYWQCVYTVLYASHIDT